jgi:hypothetical protein
MAFKRHHQLGEKQFGHRVGQRIAPGSLMFKLEITWRAWPCRCCLNASAASTASLNPGYARPSRR